jgi:hypothetical protein
MTKEKTVELFEIIKLNFQWNKYIIMMRHPKMIVNGSFLIKWHITCIIVSKLTMLGDRSNVRTSWITRGFSSFGIVRRRRFKLHGEKLNQTRDA